MSESYGISWQAGTSLKEGTRREGQCFIGKDARKINENFGRVFKGGQSGPGFVIRGISSTAARCWSCRAIDNFLLYNLPPGVTVDQFTDAFNNTCTIWPAAIADDLTFFAAQVALPVNNNFPMTWLNGTDFVQFADIVAQTLGATPVE
ncbi:hypothetical protein B0H13DRAFT_1858863 [Mycena leptocephala]|nr:hypothetical protein B0H13DRAFT_1858863 [Mycena leptocephala]